MQPVEHRVDLARLGINVRVMEVGEGPPAVFIHGATVAGPSWADLAARLPGVRCLLVDRPGCGRSEPLREPGDFDSWVEAAGGAHGSGRVGARHAGGTAAEVAASRGHETDGAARGADAGVGRFGQAPAASGRPATGDRRGADERRSPRLGRCPVYRHGHAVQRDRCHPRLSSLLGGWDPRLFHDDETLAGVRAPRRCCSSCRWRCSPSPSGQAGFARP